MRRPRDCDDDLYLDLDLDLELVSGHAAVDEGDTDADPPAAVPTLWVPNPEARYGWSVRHVRPRKPAQAQRPRRPLGFPVP